MVSSTAKLLKPNWLMLRFFFLHAVKRDTAGIRIKSYDFRSGQTKTIKNGIHSFPG